MSQYRVHLKEGEPTKNNFTKLVAAWDTLLGNEIIGQHSVQNNFCFKIAQKHVKVVHVFYREKKLPISY